MASGLYLSAAATKPVQAHPVRPWLLFTSPYVVLGALTAKSA
jgi:hypothetical protein